MSIDAEKPDKSSIDLDSFFTFAGTINGDKSVEVEIDFLKSSRFCSKVWQLKSPKTSNSLSQAYSKMIISTKPI